MALNKSVVFLLFSAIVYHILAILYFEPSVQTGASMHSSRGAFVPLGNLLAILGTFIFSIISFRKKRNYSVLLAGISLLAVLIYWLNRYGGAECAQCAAN